MIKVCIFLLAAALGAAGFLWWSRKSLVTTYCRYQHKKITEAFEGFRIVQVSDLQSERFGRGQKHLLKAVRKAEPDLIVFTGDLLDRNHTDYQACLETVCGLLELAPVYYVNGNHELALPREEVQAFYRKLEERGLVLLLDRAEEITRHGESFILAGLSEETICESKRLSGALREGEVSSRRRTGDADIEPSVVTETIRRMKTDEEKRLCILLAHEPQFLKTYAAGGPDLIFAGHAHGGQIRLPFTEGLFAPGQGLFPKLTRGMHRSGDTDMIISRGLGNSTFPFRIFNRPEVVVVILHRKR